MTGCRFFYATHKTWVLVKECRDRRGTSRNRYTKTYWNWGGMTSWSSLRKPPLKRDFLALSLAFLSEMHVFSLQPDSNFSRCGFWLMAVFTQGSRRKPLRSLPRREGWHQRMLEALLRDPQCPDLFHRVIRLLKTDSVFIFSNSLIHQITKARPLLLMFNSCG